MSYIPDTAYHKPLHYLGLVYKPHREPFQVFLRLHLLFLNPVMRSGAAAIPRMAAPSALA